MSAPFSVNIRISSGNDFAQEFYLASPDRSPMNITGCKFTGYIQKHAGAIDAICTEYAGNTGSEVNNIYYRYLEMDISVTSGIEGVYTVRVPGESTLHYPEGKYVYSITMEDVNGTKTQVLDGLCFIDFGTIQ